MKAVVRERYGPPTVLRVDDSKTPTPRGGEVLVRVHAASVNTADLDLLLGRPRVSRVFSGLRRPKTGRLGLDVAGRVAAVGEDVTALRPGDTVWADLFEFGLGSFAEYVCAPERAFAPMPEGVGFEVASTLPHSGILALQALVGKGPVRPGERVLVNGAGGCVGPFAIQIAKHFGAEVTGVDHPGKLELMRDAGADHVIDYTRQDVTRAGQRYDLIVDVAADRSFLRYRRILTPTGRYVLIARTLGGFVRAALLGGLTAAVGGRRLGTFVWRPNRKDDLDLLGKLVSAGELAPIIDRRCTLDQLPQALLALADGQPEGKIVVTVCPGAGTPAQAETGALQQPRRDKDTPDR